MYKAGSVEIVAEDAVITRGAFVTVIGIFVVVIAESWLAVASTSAEIEHVPTPTRCTVPVSCATVHTFSLLE